MIRAILTTVILLAGCSDGSHRNDGPPPPWFQEEPKPFAGCTLISSEPTGTKRYCGKACWHTLVRKTYQCDEGKREIIE